MSTFEKIIPRGLQASGVGGGAEKCREPCTCEGKTACTGDHGHCLWDACDRKADCTGRCKLDKKPAHTTHVCDHGDHTF